MVLENVKIATSQILQLLYVYSPCYLRLECLCDHINVIIVIIIIILNIIIFMHMYIVYSNIMCIHDVIILF